MKRGVCVRRFIFSLLGLIFVFFVSQPVWGKAVTIGVGTNSKGVESIVAARIEVVAGASGKADFIHDEAQYLNRAGEPQIPWKVMDVLLSPHAKGATVAGELQSSYETAGAGWEVLPSPPPATWIDGEEVVDWPAGKNIVDGRDVGIYGTDAFWPEAQVRLLGTGKLHGWRLARLAVPLVRYHPVRGELLVLADAEVSVTYRLEGKSQGGKVITGQASNRGRGRVAELAVNFEAAAGEYDDTAGGMAPAGLSSIGYTIITTSAIQSASGKLGNFVTHKQSQGFTVKVVTEGVSADSTHYLSGSTADERADNIRDWLVNNYLTDDTLYVLFIGNPRFDTFDTNSSVPMRKLWVKDINTPSDFYFADLTGDWDLDGDGIYGEEPDDFGAGGVDKYWEVLVGRIPYYGTISDTDYILQKTMDYENAGSVDWRRNALLPMVPLDGSTPAYQLGEQIKYNQLEPEAIASVRIYDENYGVNPPPEYLRSQRYPATEWAGGQYGMVIWNTHGWSGGASGVISNDDVPNLNDNYPGATFQGSCDNASPESSDNITYNLLKNGGIVTIGATRLSWYAVSESNFTSSGSTGGMGYQYAKRLVERKTCGHALYELKQAGYAWWANACVFNIYGDPSITVLGPTPAFTIIPTHTFYFYAAHTRGSLESRSYTLKNNSGSALSWTAAHNAGWFDLSSYGGSIGSLSSTTVNISLNDETASLDVETYEDTVTFADATNGIVEEREVILVIYPPELLGYWKLDESSGTTAADSSGNGNGGNLINMDDLDWVSGKFGNGLDFDGGNDYVSCGMPEILRPQYAVSVAAWIKVDSYGYYEGIAGWLHDTGSTESGYTLHTRSGGVIGWGVAAGGGMKYITDGGNSTGQWIHVVGTYDGTEQILYINGAPANSTSNSGLIDWSPLGDDGFEIGRYHDDNDNHYFDGVIDEVRVYNYALSTEEIGIIYNYGGRAEGPYPFDSAVGVPTDVTLSWVAGAAAAYHDVYIGTDETSVMNAATSSPEYMGRQSGTTFTCALDPSITYYWRIDEVTATETIIPGVVWRFTTAQKMIGLIGYWPYDGNVQDYSGLNNHGSAYGNPQYVAGKLGSNALNFDGNDYVRMDGASNDITNNNITLSAWVKTTDGAADWYSCNTSTGGNVALFGITGGKAAMYDGSGYEGHSTTSVNDNQWHMLTYVRSGSTGYIYVDGNLENTHTANFNFSSNNRWSIAQEWDGDTPSDFLIGLVDEVLMLDRSVSLPEVKYLYNNGNARSPIFAGDSRPPRPVNLTWQTVPHALSPDLISMTATKAADENGVEYFFECTAGGGHDSGWQDGATYVDTGLSLAPLYTYRVKARDKSANRNETGWSSPESVILYLPGDFEPDGDVDLADLKIFTEQYLLSSGYEEAAGFVVLEAEHYSENIPGSGPGAGSSWTQLSGGGSLGDGYLQALPDQGRVIDTDLELDAPHLSYLVNFSTAGDYYLWLKGKAVEGDTGNSDRVHYGQDGTALSFDDNSALKVPTLSSFTWISRTGALARPVLSIANAGLHRLDLWMREDGASLDRLVLTTDVNYNPVVSGEPAESAYQPQQAADLNVDGVVDLRDYAVLALYWLEGVS